MLSLITLLLLVQNANSTFQEVALKVSVKLMSRIPNEIYNNFVIIKDDLDINDREVFDEVNLISGKIHTSIQILHFK